VATGLGVRGSCVLITLLVFDSSAGSRCGASPEGARKHSPGQRPIGVNLRLSRPAQPRSGGRRWPMAREGVKKSPRCHPEEAKPTKDLCICSKVQMQGSFAALRMTAAGGFFHSFFHPALCPCGQNPRSPVLRIRLGSRLEWRLPDNYGRGGYRRQAIEVKILVQVKAEHIRRNLVTHGLIQEIF